MTSRAILSTVGPLALVAGAFGYNAHRNAAARRQLEAARRQVAATCEQQFEPMKPWFPQEGAATAFCDVATDGFDALRSRTEWWRWNLGVRVTWPVSAEKWARIAQLAKESQSRCPALISQAQKAALHGDPRDVLAFGGIRDMCGKVLPSMERTGRDPPSQPGEASVWEWAAQAARTGADWEAGHMP